MSIAGNYLRIITAAVSVILWVKGMSAFAAPVPVLIIDAPVDPIHAMIAPHYDQATMKALSFTPFRLGTTESLHEINQQHYREVLSYSFVWKHSEFQRYARALKLESLGFPAMSPEKIQVEKEVIERGSAALEKEWEWQSGLSTYFELQHGLAVTGLLTQGLSTDQIRTLHFPIGLMEKVLGELFVPPMSPDGKLPLKLMEQTRLALRVDRDVFNQLSNVIQASGAKVVNYSSGTSAATIWDALVKQFGTEWAESDPEMLSEIASLIARGRQTHFKKLVRQHPDTVFVIAAGNSGNMIPNPEYLDFRIAELKAKNLIVVGALDGKGNLATYSDFGPKRVQVAAPVVAMSSARHGGGRDITGAGTSFSAPLVARKITEIRAKYPEWSAVETIRRFYLEHTVSVPQLRSVIQQGRVLPLDPRIDAPYGRGVFVDFGNPDQICEKLFWSM